MASTIWKGHLTFGLISVPIRLTRAARAEKVHMHILQRDTGARVRRIFVPDEERNSPPPAPVAIAEPVRLPAAIHATQKNPATAAGAIPTMTTLTERATEIAGADLVRGFEYEKDRFVAFERDELEELAPRNSSEMQIIQFAKLAEVDPVYFENSYYVAPDRQGEKSYTLLYEALRKTGQSAVAEFVMHRRDQVILLRSGSHGIIAHTLFHDDEVRAETEFRADSAQVSTREMDLAVQLIEALAAPFEPSKFKDKYRERLNARIADKIAHGGTQEQSSVKAAPVIDIMEALKASLAQARKPVASEAQSSESAPSRKKRFSGSRG